MALYHIIVSTFNNKSITYIFVAALVYLISFLQLKDCSKNVLKSMLIRYQEKAQK